ncbi:MAG: type II secretion system F family protein [Planctomycetaceae bacterium]|nr:type II secretion system F family protein [Planctomycetaceae bacterium]
MFFSPRLGLKPMAGLCRRLSTSIGAGIDVRTIWAREAQRAVGPLRTRLLDVSRAVNRGETLTDALALTDDFFPSLFRELITVGEQSGQLEVVLSQLADHYQGQLTVRRTFLASIAWPLIELVATLVVIGFFIWLMGALNLKSDVFGFGLVGTRGLVIYVSFLAVLGVAGWLLLQAIARGMVWTQPVQRLTLQLPVLGKALQTLALSRLAWSMQMTMNTGMDVRRSLKLSLNSTGSARFIDQIPVIDGAIVRGNSIHEAFSAAGGYPLDFLDTLAVGEESGQVVESMGRLARQYQEQARMAIVALAMAAAWLIWAAIAAVIIVIIFRVFSFYVGAINNVLPR